MRNKKDFLFLYRIFLIQNQNDRLVSQQIANYYIRYIPGQIVAQNRQ